MKKFRQQMCDISLKAVVSWWISNVYCTWIWFRKLNWKRNRLNVFAWNHTIKNWVCTWNIFLNDYTHASCVYMHVLGLVMGLTYLTLSISCLSSTRCVFTHVTQQDKGKKYKYVFMANQIIEGQRGFKRTCRAAELTPRLRQEP